MITTLLTAGLMAPGAGGGGGSAGPTPTFVGASDFYDGLSTVTLSVPAGVADDDFMVVMVVGDGTGNSITPPAGWTEELALRDLGATSLNEVACYSRVASSEPASYDWAFTGDGNPSAGMLLAFRGVDTAAPIDVDRFDHFASTNQWGPAALTTTTDSARLVILCTGSPNRSFTTPPAGFTTEENQAHGGSAGYAHYAGHAEQATAGDTGAKTLTADGNGHATTWFLALKPAPGAGGLVFTDDFNRATENLEASADWTRLGGVSGGAIVNASNQVEHNTLTETMYHAPDLGTADHYCQIEVLQASQSFPLATRISDNENAMILRDDGQVEFYRYEAASFNQLISANNPSRPYTLKLRSRGDVHLVEAPPGTPLAIGFDDFNNTETKAGMLARRSGDSYDNWESGEEVGDKTAPGTVEFEEDFSTGFSGGENLESSVNWARVDGAAGDISINATPGTADFNSTGPIGALYQSPDVGSADHWTEAEINGAQPHRAFPLCVRATDASNYIGARWYVTGSTVQVYKRESGSFTLLSEVGYGNIGGITNNVRFRLEAEGNTIRLYVNDMLLIETTESFNNTETRQGMNTRDSTYSALVSNYRAGTF